MISRTILRQSRAALGSSVRSPPARQFLPANIHSVRALAAPSPFSRWYSSEPEAKTADEASKDAKDAGNGKAAEGEDAVKSQLEKKDKEIIELKVNSPSEAEPRSQGAKLMHCQIGQIPSLSR